MARRMARTNPRITTACRTRRLLLTAAIVGLISSPVSAQPLLVPPQPFPHFQLSDSIELEGANKVKEAGRHLEQAVALIADRQWDEAIERLLSVMENYGKWMIHQDQVQDDRDRRFRRYVSLRTYCHWLLARLAETHPEALDLYRQGVDPVARRWYEQGVRQREERTLRRVVDQLYTSSYGDDALFALGEMALERGDHNAARRYWEQISPQLRTPDGRPIALELSGVPLHESWERIHSWLDEPRRDLSWLAFPDTDLDLNEVRARLVLVSILEGAGKRAGKELELLRKLAPDAEGRMLGQHSNYAVALSALLERSDAWPPEVSLADWPTFAGSIERNGIAPRGVDLVARPIWSIPIAKRRSDRSKTTHSSQRSDARVAEDPSALLSYHPVVVGDLLLVNDTTSIRAFNVFTGRSAFTTEDVELDDPQYGVIFRPPSLTVQHEVLPVHRVGVPRFTMTAHGDWVFARMGSPATGRPVHVTSSPASGYLVGLDLEAEGRLLPGFPIWPDDETWYFEGSPVTDGTFVYVAMRKNGAAAARAYVACFDIQTGRRKWRRMISSAETPGHGVAEQITTSLLTLNEDVLYLNTNLGVVAAIDVHDGVIQWLTAYPRASQRKVSQKPAHFDRDLNPCIYHRGVLYVAPSDSASIFALDATTGHLIWDSFLPDDVMHLLGVGKGNLIASGDRLWWLDAQTGKVIPEGCFPFGGSRQQGRAAPAPRARGRGLLVDRQVWWPTQEGIYIFDQQYARHLRTVPWGAPQVPPFLTHGGNLLISHGQLYVATADRLLAFNQYGRLVKRPAP